MVFEWFKGVTHKFFTLITDSFSPKHPSFGHQSVYVLFSTFYVGFPQRVTVEMMLICSLKIRANSESLNQPLINLKSTSNQPRCPPVVRLSSHSIRVLCVTWLFSVPGNCTPGDLILTR